MESTTFVFILIKIKIVHSFRISWAARDFRNRSKFSRRNINCVGIDNLKQKFSIIFALVVGSIVLLSLNQVYAQENGNEVIVTIVKGSADAGSGENKYDGEKHSGYGFDPRELTIEKGTIVKWVSNDTTIHTVTSGKPSSNTIGTAFDSSYLNAGEPYLHKFNKKGTYDYYCTMYPFMKGKIIVK
jgi:plastocyanin